jgi:hypothetical protein
MGKATAQDVAYQNWKADKDNEDSKKTITLRNHEACIIIKLDLSVETYVNITQDIQEPELLALGISWALENADWKKKITRKAREKLLKICDEEGVAYTTPSHTHED